MRVSCYALYNLTGWHTNNTKRFFDEETITYPTSATLWNVQKLGGYVPGVGILMGILDIELAAENATLPTIARVYLVVRGIFEILGLGILFSIPDIFTSIHRLYAYYHPDSMVIPDL